MNARYFLTVTVVLLATGCQSYLNVSKLDKGASSPQQGFVYPLQFTQFKIDVTRGIASCERTVGGKKVPDVKPFVKATITSENVDDGDFTYVIDSNSLASVTKTSDLSVTWENGKLTAFNASADDKTGEIISSVVTGISTLAISSVNPLAVVRAAAPEPVVECDDKVKTAVKNISTYKGEIEKISSEISNLSEEIKAQNILLSKGTSNAQPNCNLNQNVNHPVCIITDKLGELNAKSNELKENQKLLDQSLSVVSYKNTYRWPETSDIDATANPYLAEASIIDKWVIDSSTSDLKESAIQDFQKSKSAFADSLKIYFKINKIGSYGISDLSKYKDTGKKEDGLRYRVPASGYIVVCKTSICDRDDKTNVVTIKTDKIHQLGHIFNVPFKSTPFSNRELKMTFDDNGLPKTASVSNKESVGENIGNTFSKLAEEYALYEKVKKELDPDKTELEEIQEQTALLQAQHELTQAQAQLNPTEATTQLQELQIKTQLAQAQKEYLDALAALEPALPEEKSENEEEIAVLQSETTLILARAAYFEALLAQKEAEEALNK